MLTPSPSMRVRSTPAQLAMAGRTSKAGLFLPLPLGEALSLTA
jgi:hypothetical protein